MKLEQCLRVGDLTFLMTDGRREMKGPTQRAAYPSPLSSPELQCIFLQL